MDRPVTGLRERKKARTKAAIQQHALRLFRAQGYQATTVEQIAEAAEVAPSTVFRYFATKEDLAVLDDGNTLAEAISRALRAQPPDVSPFRALRGALRDVFGSLSPGERAARYERGLLMLTIPELWVANLGLIGMVRNALREGLARRGQDPAGVITDAVIGVGLGVLLDWAKDPHGDPAIVLDDALARLESG